VPRQAELSDKRRVRVVAGILLHEDGSVLIADRKQSRSLKDYWEFPGGKIADGEGPDAALRRELSEELGIDVVPGPHFHRIEHDYPDIAVAVDFYLVSEWRGTPAGCEGQEIRWVHRQRLAEQKLLPADAPVVDALLSL
jgi:8-oxo-dGTP diphosphatase